MSYSGNFVIGLELLSLCLFSMVAMDRDSDSAPEAAMKYFLAGAFATAILLYGIPRVVIGENETFMGGEDYLRSRGVEVINLDSPECKALMAEFIERYPDVWNEDIGEE